jgi:hypothetical protein
MIRKTGVQITYMLSMHEYNCEKRLCRLIKYQNKIIIFAIFGGKQKNNELCPYK